MKIKTDLRDQYERFHQKVKVQRKIIKWDNFTYFYQLEVLRKFLKNSFRILDVGCGVGTIDFLLAKEGKKVVGIDVSKNAINICKKNSKFLKVDQNTTFIKDNFLQTKKIKGKFDSILCFEVLEHLNNEILALKKFKQLLNKNGILIISVPSSNSILYKSEVLKKFDKEVGHLRRYTPELIFNLINKNFKVIKMIKVESPIRNILFISKKLRWIVAFLNHFGPVSVLFNFMDKLICHILGESNIIIVAQKE